MENRSLFDAAITEEFISRINKLDSSSHAQWGKMNVAQMLHHCQKPLEIASGSLKPTISRIVRALFGKAAKAKLLSDKPFARNLPTFKEAVIVSQHEFETEKDKLVAYLREFQNKGKDGVTKNDHPFFGSMIPEEWDILQVKHLDHHLKQFGV